VPDSKVKLPGLGEVNKKTALIGGVGVAAVIAIGVWRYRQKAAAAQASATQQSNGAAVVTDPAGNECAQVDALTGYCPGTPEDEQAQEQAAEGSSIGEDEGIGGEDGYGGSELYTDPNGNQCYQPDADGYCPQTTTTGTGTGSSAVTTNDEWYQEVVAAFPTYGAAIAGVLGGVTVTTAQKNQFLEAVGVFGQPPGGYPQPIKTSDTGGQPAPGTKVTVPNFVGSKAAEASEAAKGAGLKLSGNNVPKGKTGTVISQTPKQGARVNTGTTVTVRLRIS
jgi:hypothetical protein